MWTGQLDPVSNREDWLDNIIIKDFDTGVPIPLDGEGTDLTLAVSPKGSRAYPVLLASISNGRLTVDPLVPTIATMTFTRAEMQQLPPGEYDVGITMLYQGTVSQIFAGRMPIIDGVVP